MVEARADTRNAHTHAANAEDFNSVDDLKSDKPELIPAEVSAAELSEVRRPHEVPRLAGKER